MVASIANRFLDLLQRWGWVLGCVLVALLFVASGWGKLMNPHGTAAAMRDVGLPLGALVYVAIAVELLGGIALAVGFRRQSAALLLLLFLAVTTLSFHNFWHYAGQEQQGQIVQF
jgi:putative oxidoreductase